MTEQDGQDGQDGQADGVAPDAVLLDVDGTLLDSTYHHALAWHRAFDQRSGDPDGAAALSHRDGRRPAGRRGF